MRRRRRLHLIPFAEQVDPSVEAGRRVRGGKMGGREKEGGGGTGERLKGTEEVAAEIDEGK